MADKFYSVILGEQVPALVTEGASTSGEAIEIRVNDSVWGNKLLVAYGIEALLNHIVLKETNPIV